MTRRVHAERMAMASPRHRVCQHCGKPTLLPAAHFDLCHGLVVARKLTQAMLKANPANTPRSVYRPAQADAAALTRGVIRGSRG